MDGKLQRNSYEYYTLYTNAIICSKVPNKKIDEIIYYQEGKKYYNPTEAELLAHANPNYREQNEYMYALVNEEPYHSMGIRRIPIENRPAFYIVDENGKNSMYFPNPL